jgi:P-type E1-E2 ATPase
VQGDMTPEDKKNGIDKLQKRYGPVAMIGDGINDAPALALANVGMVFSSHEQTASTEAADIVFLGHEIGMVTDTIRIGKATIEIAMQSISIGIGISILGMIFAAFGFIPPVAGAAIQEVLDIFVILNALRAVKL